MLLLLSYCSVFKVQNCYAILPTKLRFVCANSATHKNFRPFIAVSYTHLEVQVADEPGAYPKAEQYLTLANKTDEAFKKLIDYFSAQTEPTILVMFGDHQPSVEQEFLDKAYGVTQDEMTMAQYMDKFKVPFIIWANYPLTGDSTKITSLNFLAQYVLRNAGIETSAYGKYLWNLQKTICLLYTSLPDKEFRYLRTVIVTAAVYWGLNSKLRR